MVSFSQYRYIPNILKIDNYKYREILTSFFSTQQHEWPSKPAGISYQVDKKL